MRPSFAVLIAGLALAAPVLAADDAPRQGEQPPALVQPVPAPGGGAAAPVEEPPTFSPVRPAEIEPPAPQAAPEPPPAPPVVRAAPPPPPPPAAVAPAVSADQPPPPPPAGLPAWAAGILVLVGGLIAGTVGMLTASQAATSERRERKQAAAITLALELDARRQAFEAVPVPPNADAGVSFVSAVASLADMDHGWRAMHGSVHLLPDKLAGHLAVHYAAVHHVATFVKGQSIAAAVRMLQANRIGGHPCPDASTMRESHVELAAAFRGVEKMIQTLRTVK